MQLGFKKGMPSWFEMHRRFHRTTFMSPSANQTLSGLRVPVSQTSIHFHLFPRRWFLSCGTVYRTFQAFNDVLDSGRVQSTSWMARIFIESVTPVWTEDPWGFQVTQALEEHK